MGQIRIELSGSFRSNGVLRTPGKLVSAAEHGHAAAVAEAIAYLSRDVLPGAIQLDHQLHDEGERPSGEFGK